MIYQLIKKLIKDGKTLGLQTKVDVFYLNNKLTDEEYEEITKLLSSSETEDVSTSEESKATE